MKNKKQSVQNADDDKHEAAKGEENEDCSYSSDFLSDEDYRCPICLNCLVEQEVGFPENCKHIFCMACILKWAETRASCPMDRKQFKAVYKLNTSEDSVKVQIKQQISKKDDIISCNKGKNCPITMKTCKRKQENVSTSFLPVIYKSWNPNYNPSNKEEVTNSVKKNKPRRQTCLNRFFKSNWCDRFSSNSSFSDVAPNYQSESIEISKIDTIIRHKRRELELSCSVLAKVARIPSISSEAEIVPCLVLETVFSISTSPLENFGSSKSGHIISCVHEGEEKKQTSNTTGTRGTKRKVSDTTPRRRSARNIKTETSYQCQSSPKSSNSGYEASSDGSSFVNVSFTELEKLTSKRKAKRNAKQQEPLAKKKLRSSGPYGKASNNIDFDEADETEITFLLDKGNSADSENSTSDLTHKNVDTESSNGVENSYVAYKKKPKEHYSEGQDTLDILETGSCVQDPPLLALEKAAGSCVEDLPLLTLEGNTEKCEEKVDTETENKLYCKNPVEPDQDLNIPGEQLCDDNIIFTHQSPEVGIPTIELPAKLNPLAVTHQIVKCPGKELGKTECMLLVDDISAVSRHELLGGTESVPGADNLLADTRNEFQGKLDSEPIVNKLVFSHTNELRRPESSAIDGILEKPIIELTEEIVKEPLDNISCEVPLYSLGVQVVEIEKKESNVYITNEYINNDDLLINVSSDNKLNLSFENDKVETETNTSPKRCTEDIKHFNKDDSEIVSIEYDSFNSNQNASQLNQPLANDNVEQKANVLQNDSKHSISFSNPDKKEAKESFIDKKTRTRRSRFHSPSTTWSPSKREGKRSQSPSPKREIGEGRTSRSPKRDIFKESWRSLSKSPKRNPATSPSSSPRTHSLKEEKQSLRNSPRKDHLREGRDSPTSSPKKDSIKDGIRSSQMRAKESPPRHKCRSPSRDRANDKNEFRRDNERGRSRRRWSQSQSRSRSRSRSRPRSKGLSFPRSERDGCSPRWKERWTDVNWRDPRGSDRYKRNEQQKQTECMKSERDSVNKDADTQSSSDQYRKDYPDWVMERINSVPETRNRERDNFKNQQRKENRHNDSGALWSANYGSGWNSNRGRSSHGRGNRGRGSFTYGEQAESRWQNRKGHSRNANSSGNETSRFPEHHPYKRKAEQDFTFDTPADRSGWTSASSWAVRKTLPADVQNYYSRRGRNSSSPQSVWTKEEAASEQDPNFKDQTSQQSDTSQLPVTVLQPQMNVMTSVNTQHQPMSIFPYTMAVPTPIMNIQHNPFNLPPPVPMHLHSGLPLVQVAASSSVSQGPPPPPPPPPPSQQINFLVSQLDGQQLQAAPTTSHVANSVNTTAALRTVESIQGSSSGNTASSNNIKSSNAAVKLMEKKVNVTVEASADSSKKDQKLLIQEKAAQEVKLAIKPFYQNKDISKEEYKEIVRKAVDKVCHSKSGEVNSAKVATLVKAYVDKYRHSRKRNPDETVSVERK
ncbi:protein SCAF11 [Pseudonaja textilis]|uniref:SR-related CTD associated factor 11 n=1 Tax=Pseudonaja textilis TaxID=8673 RepID=A0A670XYW6_PSETE|nr:protein SCAF11 [Pseudonaja textilis]